MRVDNKQTLIDYVNNKNGGNSRENDQITKFTVFSHGWKGTMSLGYNYNDKTNNTKLDFNISDITELHESAFDNPDSWFGSCNLGTGGDASFGQAWVNRVGGTAWAFKGKTNYEYIVKPKGYNKFLPWFWDDRSKINKGRKDYGFILTGSFLYPTAASGAKEVEFTR